MNILIKEEDIKKRVKELGKEINNDYKGKNPILIGVLKGAFVFLADLLRELEISVEIDFLGISSYTGTKSSGIVRITQDLSLNIEDRDVILIEDIVDSGRTLEYIINNLKTRRPRSIAVCTLLNKKDARVVDVPITYVGFNIPRVFVVGYGLDYENKFRNLKYIGVYHGE
ncbi:MAG: hypoxanthine phosphoribosyltransferase [candidate division WOR-3 bacterium]|nr:hypoxanthine phosphoribosyltransferase [candidate division WOR-3 bacterium]